MTSRILLSAILSAVPQSKATQRVHIETNGSESAAGNETLLRCVHKFCAAIPHCYGRQVGCCRPHFRILAISVSVFRTPLGLAYPTTHTGPLTSWLSVIITHNHTSGTVFCNAVTDESSYCQYAHFHWIICVRCPVLFPGSFQYKTEPDL